MKLNEFIDGFFQTWGNWVEPSKESRENLKKTYIVLQDLGVTENMTAEQAKRIYPLFVDWYNYGARLHAKDEEYDY